MTDETLVNVIGWVTRDEAIQLASALRPINEWEFAHGKEFGDEDATAARGQT